MREIKRKILIIEDDLDIRDGLTSVLVPTYEVLAAKNGEEGLTLAESFGPDLIVLDILMPGLDGIAVCEILREGEKTKETPIIVITATHDEDQRVRSFLAGADDVVSKPLKIKEFLARIQSKFRKIENQSSFDKVLSCGNLSLDSQRFEATIDGKPVTLTAVEFKLLRYFVQNKERVMTRNMILELMWQKDVTERVIDNHIMSLRKKLKGSEYGLVSIYGVGYSFKKAV